MARIGEKRNIVIPGTNGQPGRIVPGIIISEESQSVVQVPSRTVPGTMRNQPVFRADILSLRETLPDADGNVTTYYAITSENLRFSPPRFNMVPGLDFDPETKAQLSLEVLVARATESILALAERRSAAQADTELDVALG